MSVQFGAVDRYTNRRSFASLLRYIVDDMLPTREPGTFDIGLGAVEYDLSDSFSRVSAIRTFGVYSVRSSASEMEVMAESGHLPSAPLTLATIGASYSYVLSWSQGERPTNAQVWQAVEIANEALGAGGNQYVAARHRDTDNDHVHVLLCRVHPQTKAAFGLWKCLEKLDRACARIELVQGWSAGKRFGDRRTRVQPEWVMPAAKAIHDMLERPRPDWAKAIALAGEFGVEIEQRKGGYVLRLERDHRRSIKASAVGLGQLNAKLGSLAAQGQGLDPFERYAQSRLSSQEASEAERIKSLDAELRQRRRDLRDCGFAPATVRTIVRNWRSSRLQELSASFAQERKRAVIEHVAPGSRDRRSA